MTRMEFDCTMLPHSRMEGSHSEWNIQSQNGKTYLQNVTTLSNGMLYNGMEFILVILDWRFPNLNISFHCGTFLSRILQHSML